MTRSFAPALSEPTIAEKCCCLHTISIMLILNKVTHVIVGHPFNVPYVYPLFPFGSSS